MLLFSLKWTGHVCCFKDLEIDAWSLNIASVCRVKVHLFLVQNQYLMCVERCWLDCSSFPRDFNRKNIVVQYVLSEQHQILVCETSTILFAFCGMTRKPAEVKWLCRNVPPLLARWGFSSSSPNMNACGRHRACSPQPGNSQFVCRFNSGVSPPAMSFLWAEETWEGQPFSNKQEYPSYLRGCALRHLQRKNLGLFLCLGGIFNYYLFNIHQ